MERAGYDWRRGARWQEHLRHRAGRSAPARAGIRQPHSARRSDRLPAGTDAHRKRFRHAGAGVGDRHAAAASRHRHRFARARPIRLRQQSRQLQSRGRARRRGDGSDRARRAACGLHRQFAGRTPDHAHGRGPSDRDRRCRIARYRPGDRAEGAGAPQELCRQAAGAAQFCRRRRDPAPAVHRPISSGHGGGVARSRTPHLAHEGRRADADL